MFHINVSPIDIVNFFKVYFVYVLKFIIQIFNSFLQEINIFLSNTFIVLSFIQTRDQQSAKESSKLSW